MSKLDKFWNKASKEVDLENKVKQYEDLLFEIVNEFEVLVSVINKVDTVVDAGIIQKFSEPDMDVVINSIISQHVKYKDLKGIASFHGKLKEFFVDRIRTTTGTSGSISGQNLISNAEPIAVVPKVLPVQPQNSTQTVSGNSLADDLIASISGLIPAPVATGNLEDL